MNRILNVGADSVTVTRYSVAFPPNHVFQQFILLGENLGDIHLLPIGSHGGENVEECGNATSLYCHV